MIELAWICNTTGSEYIDTEFIPNQNTRVVMSVSSAGRNAYFFNSWSNEWNKLNYSYVNDYEFSNGNAFSAYGDQHTRLPLITEAVIDYDKNVLKINETTAYTYTQTAFQSLYPLYIFAQNQNGTTYFPPNNGTFKIHYCKIYDNDALVRDFIPALDDDNNPCLYEKVEHKYYYNSGTGGFSFSAPACVKKYLIFDNGTIYTVSDNTLVEVQGELNAQIFIDNGIDTIPDGALLIPLTSPEVLCWTNSDTVPRLKAQVKATPQSQVIITDKIYLTDKSITGIESALATCEGDLIVAVSFDDKQTWKAWNGEQWATLSDDNTGMSKETLEAITFEQWNELYTGATGFYVRVSLLDITQSVEKIVFDFAN